MRVIFMFLALVFATSSNAQTTLPGSFQNNGYNSAVVFNRNANDSSKPKKWFLTRNTGIMAGYSFSRFGGASFMAAPVGLQLNRRLSNNVYAFAGVTVAPAYLNFNHAFLTTDLNKVNSLNSYYQPRNFSMYSAATLGLMYVNDQRTFSVSGSISVEKSSSPFFGNSLFYDKPNNLILR